MVSNVAVFAPRLARRETLPVGTGDPGETVTFTLTDWPCVRVTGLVGGVVESVSAVADGVKATELHCPARFAAFTEPSPVARS
jgi:hypothetical protein